MKALILSENFFEDSELFYPYFRLIEEGYKVDIAALKKGIISGEYFFKVKANLSFDDVNPKDYKLLIIPGGRAPESIRGNKDATCYSGIIDDLINAKANYKDEKVVVCENIITSRCPDDLPYFMREIMKKIF